LRADEKHIRTQSAILEKNNPKPLLLLSVQKTRLPRSAQVRSSHATEFKTPNGLDPP